jgi:hypothetical protein
MLGELSMRAFLEENGVPIELVVVWSPIVIVAISAEGRYDLGVIVNRSAIDGVGFGADWRDGIGRSGLFSDSALDLDL